MKTNGEMIWFLLPAMLVGMNVTKHQQNERAGKDIGIKLKTHFDTGNNSK